MKTQTIPLQFERLSEISATDGKALRRLAALLNPAAAFDLPSLRRFVRNGTTEIFVLRDGADLAAAATAVRFTTPTGSPCRIEDVVVDKKHRGKGCGRRIMTEVLDALRRDGVAGIELTSRPSRVAANALYQALGFARRETNVYEFQF